MTNMFSGTITINQFPLRYSIEGEGPTAIVIGSAIYYPHIFSQNLRQHLRLVFLDHRGFVPSPTEIDVNTFTLDDIEHMRKTLNLGRVIMIGHSGHGFMALEYAKKYPDHVSHVVLIGMGPSQSAEYQAMADQYFQDVVDEERKLFLEKNLSLLQNDIESQPDKRFIILLFEFSCHI